MPNFMVIGSCPRLSASDAVPALLGHTDAESFQEPASTRRGDGHGPAVLHSLRPAQIEAALRERGSDRARNVWASFGPIEAESAKLAAARAQRGKVDPELGEKTGAR